MSDRNKNKAVFFDRDGTINIDKGYVYKIEDFEFQPGIINLIKYYIKQGYIIFIITNQSGIARGFYSEHEFIKLTNWMLKQFAKHDIKIAKVYHCPHFPCNESKCNCRKPKPGMILQAVDEFNIDLAQSILIGDKRTDILAGKNAGIRKNLYIQDLLENGIF